MGRERGLRIVLTESGAQETGMKGGLWLTGGTYQRSRLTAKKRLPFKDRPEKSGRN